MFHSRARMLVAAGILARIDVSCVVIEEPVKPEALIIDPPRYRDTRIKGSYDDNVAPSAVKDPDAMSAADAKRARKAAKRLKETKHVP